MAAAHDRRTGFSRRRQYGMFVGYVLAVAGALVGVALLAISTFNPPAFAALRMGVAGVTTPVANVLALAVNSVATIPDTIGNYIAVHDENAQLRASLAAERALVIRARAVVHENGRLRRLVRLRDATVDTVAVARLVSSSASSGRRFAFLNAGRWQGVLPGMPVRDGSGLVGRVVETGPNAARILLLSDPESVVPVQRTRDGLPAVAAGRGDGMIDIRVAVGNGIALARGDLFVTSGVGGLYAPGVPVALLPKSGIDTVPVRPFTAPDTLDIALVQRPFLPPPPPPAAPPIAAAPPQ